jgi:hypothetical protein
MTRDVLFQPVRTNKAARAWLVACLEFIGGGFHPDTPGDQYIIVDASVAYRTSRVVGRTFTPEEARKFDSARMGMFKHINDPYDFCLGALANAHRKDIKKR